MMVTLLVMTIISSEGIGIMPVQSCGRSEHEALEPLKCRALPRQKVGPVKLGFVRNSFVLRLLLR